MDTFLVILISVSLLAYAAARWQGAAEAWRLFRAMGVPAQVLAVVFVATMAVYASVKDGPQNAPLTGAGPAHDGGGGAVVPVLCNGSPAMTPAPAGTRDTGHGTWDGQQSRPASHVPSPSPKRTPLDRGKFPVFLPLLCSGSLAMPRIVATAPCRRGHKKSRHKIFPCAGIFYLGF